MGYDEYYVNFDGAAEKTRSVCKVDIKNWCLFSVEIAHVTPEIMAKACPCIDNNLIWNIKHSYFLSRTDAKLTFGSNLVSFHGMRGRVNGAPCEAPDGVGFGLSALSPLEQCARNFEHGKCKCPLMGGIVGACLLPELYQKQK